jgi:hypothetical protein
VLQRASCCSSLPVQRAPHTNAVYTLCTRLHVCMQVQSCANTRTADRETVLCCASRRAHIVYANIHTLSVCTCMYMRAYNTSRKSNSREKDSLTSSSSSRLRGTSAKMASATRAFSPVACTTVHSSSFRSQQEHAATPCVHALRSLHHTV